MKRMRNWIWIGAVGITLVLAVAGLIWREDISNFFRKENAISFNEVGVYQQYNGKVSVDFELHRITGTLQVDAINKTQIDQKAIYFHLYPNVFKESNKLRGENWDYVLGSDRTSGWIGISHVQVNGRDQPYQVKDTILEIPLEQWKSADQVTVLLDFTLQIPKNNGRLSYDENSTWLGNWLPILAEYDERGWYLDPYYPIGDPFYSDIANYDLEIEIPSGYQMASTGVETKQVIAQNGNRQTNKVSARQVRDFALVIMDQSYKVMRDEVNGLAVNTWYRDADSPLLAKKLHKAGIDSLSYFSDSYGAYPYEEYDIVRTGGFFGGMEYPGLVFIQGAYFEENDDYGVVVVAHETAHQWWYGLVGNNEVSDPWMDESLTDYSTLRFLIDQRKSIGQAVLKNKERAMSYTEQYERNNEYIGNSVDQFSDWMSYGTIVYYKGSMMFYQLEQAIGLEKMNQVLSDYFQQYQYNNASDEELISVFEKHLGSEARSYFESWLNGGEAEFVQ